MILCSFSDWKQPLNEAPRTLKGAKLHKWLLRNIKDRPRISVWEIDSNIKVCRALMYLKRIGKISFTKEHKYPYTGIKINN